MLKQVEILVILIIFFLNVGCSERKFINISDCEHIKDSLKRDKCFTSLIEQIPSDNTELRIKTCEKIINTEMRDLCSFKVAHESWRFMSPSNLDTLCDKIGNHFLKQSCKDIQNRPHLQQLQQVR